MKRRSFLATIFGGVTTAFARPNCEPEQVHSTMHMQLTNEHGAIDTRKLHERFQDFYEGAGLTLGSVVVSSLHGPQYNVMCKTQRGGWRFDSCTLGMILEDGWPNGETLALRK